VPAAMQIGIPLFANVTQLDFTGPWEVFTRVPGATCHLLAPDLQPVRSASGLAVLPTSTYDACPQLDVVCVPGGPGHLAAMEDERMLSFLRRQERGCRYLTAVCTGALVLAAAGLLRGYRATTHWMSLDRLAAFGAIPVSDRVVTDRNRVTGGGVTAGIDFALTLVAAMHGESVARALQLQIEYAPAPPFGDGHPGVAAPNVVEAVRRFSAPYAARMAEIDARAAAKLATLSRR
jgi:cyclohexyl-isocyanide hydratase